MIDPITQRAEEIRETTGVAWERACIMAEREIATCGTCGHRWNTALEPTPAMRCPREYDHEEADADPVALGNTLGIVPPNPSVNMPAFAVDMIDAQGNGDVTDAVLGIRGKVLDVGDAQPETTVYVVAVSREEAAMVAHALDQWAMALADGDVDEALASDALDADWLAKRFRMVPGA